jgi:hypothetical protein
VPTPVHSVDEFLEVDFNLQGLFAQFIVAGCRQTGVATLGLVSRSHAREGRAFA